MINNRSELIAALNAHKNKQSNYKGATAKRCVQAIQYIKSAVPLNQVLAVMPKTIAKQIDIGAYDDFA